MNVSMLRQRTYANNIANVTTHGYKRMEVKFEEEFRQVLYEDRMQGQASNTEHYAIGKEDWQQVEPTVFQPEDTALVNGINNVDIDREMAKLSENALRFKTQATIVARQFSQIRYAIRGR